MNNQKMIVEPLFQRVADQFFQQVSDQPYGGASLAIFQNGRPVVDIWAGESSPGNKWSRDTKCVVFSATKGFLTLLVLRAVERGEIDVDERVSSYWPEFGCNGK